MNNHEIRHQLFQYLNANADTYGRAVMSDSIVLSKGSVVTKIPRRKCKEEIYVFERMKAAGINMPKILKKEILSCPLGDFETYCMEKISEPVDVIESESELLTPDYYSFLRGTLESLGNVLIRGFGSITMSDGESSVISSEYTSKKEFLHSRLNSALSRSASNSINITHNQVEDNVQEDVMGHLAHSDILKNIVFSKSDKKYYLLDPQINTSSANKDWDLSLYLIYANAFHLTSGLMQFLETIQIEGWEEFVVTAGINSLERINYYSRHDGSKVEEISDFAKKTQDGYLLVGQESIRGDKLCQKKK